MLVQSLGWEDPMEEEMVTPSSIVAWRIPWTDVPGGLESMSSQRVRHNWVTEHSLMYFYFAMYIFFIYLAISKRSNCQHPLDHRKSIEKSSRKTFISPLLTIPKPLTVWIKINCGKFWKRWEYQTTWPASWETCMQVRKQQLELDMEQQTGSK